MSKSSLARGPARRQRTSEIRLNQGFGAGRYNFLNIIELAAGTATITLLGAFGRGLHEEQASHDWMEGRVGKN